MFLCVQKEICLYYLLRGIHEIKFLERQVLMSQLQFSSVAQSCPILWELMDCSTPGLPVYHQLPEFTQNCVHWVSDAIQPSYPLSPCYPSAFNLSQHQDIFQCQPFLMNIQDWFSLGLILLMSLLSKALLRVFSSTTVQKYQFFGTQSSLWSNSHIHISDAYWKNHNFGYTDLCQQSIVSAF